MYMKDIMRKDAGVDGDAQRLGQIAWMFFLRGFLGGYFMWVSVRYCECVLWVALELSKCWWKIFLCLWWF